MAPPPAPAPLSEAVRKVDRAVARLEELQSSIGSRNRNGDRRQERPLVRQKLDVHVEAKPRRPHGSAVKGGQSEKTSHRRRRTMPAAGLANKRVPEIVEALSRKGTISEKENGGGKKKSSRKFAVESSPSVAKADLCSRGVLESRPINVILTDQGFPPPLSSGYGAKQCKENRRVKPADVVHNSGRHGRPPWKNVTGISTNNRHAPTIAERVRPNSATTTGSHHTTTMAASRTGTQTLAVGAECSELSANQKIQNRASFPATWLTSKAGTMMASACAPPSAREDIDYGKTFCVDVRPDPNRPWRLVSKKSSIARPLVMFPNPAFRLNADQGMRDADMGISTHRLQHASPKLKPFKSFQLRPLKLSSLHRQPLFEPSPATIRPYLSPSKTSPRQSRPLEEDDPLAFLMGSRAPKPAAPSLSSLDSNRSSSLKKPEKESIVVPSQKERWLSKRLSLPCSPSSSKSFLKRFSLLHSSRCHTNNNTYSPAKPLPSLITRLPAQTMPTSIDSLLVTPSPPPRLAKSLSNSTSGTPLVSPLPLPQGLRVLTSSKPHKLEASSSRGRSSSCQLLAKHVSQSGREEQRVNVHPSLSSRGPRETKESKKKPLQSGFSGCNGSCVWPSMKQSSLSCQSHSLGCTYNCTGAGSF